MVANRQQGGMVDADIDRLIEQGVREGLFTAAACIASVQGLVLHHHWYGVCHTVGKWRQPTSAASMFDVGPLTQYWATSVACVHLHSHHQLPLNLPLRAYLPAWDGAMTPADLLLQTVAWPPNLPTCGQDTATWQQQLQTMVAKQAATVVLGREHWLNFYLLGLLIAQQAPQHHLGNWLCEHVYRPLGLHKELKFCPVPLPDNKAQDEWVVSGYCEPRRRMLLGEVWDDCAYAHRGVSGHAGLFASARGLWNLAQSMLDASLGKDHFFHGPTLLRFWQLSHYQGHPLTLGWQRNHAKALGVGKRLPRTAMGGHSPYGCAVWIERGQQIVAVFLSNASMHRYPTSPATAVVDWQSRLHQLTSRVFDRIVALADAAQP